MSSLQYFDYEGFGERSKKDINYSQAVRIGDRIEVSGQGGWDRITEEFPEILGEEVDRAFDNVEHALQRAGGSGLEQVYKLRIYITGPIDEYFESLVKNMKGRPGFQNHGPLLTVVEVKSLYKIMRIEIEAEAYLG
ncbi:Endoribonuclease L-PSP/chorismate mutase-like protein [Ampelomyces quisqualis]|uniref:Endoribonuclease L-PSP/chorismate mutase-like protein n=1 Tax=Ampelomyces quisqualis TaxID=50730 RepID=A0A6A5QV50_AMPQU|nr:Endoribonuclease L-PSP/chorismate mutase-like protein [Ampelomyces quisqualis]